MCEIRFDLSLRNKAAKRLQFRSLESVTRCSCSNDAILNDGCARSVFLCRCCVFGLIFIRKLVGYELNGPNCFVEIDSQDCRAELSLAGEANGVPPLPHCSGRAFDLARFNLTPKTTHWIGYLNSRRPKTRSKNTPNFRSQIETAFSTPCRNLLISLDFRSRFETGKCDQNLTAKSSPGDHFRAQSEPRFRPPGAIQNPLGESPEGGPKLGLNSLQRGGFV